MSMNLNPITLADEELKKILSGAVPKEALHAAVLDLIFKTVERERLTMDAHPQCGANNPEGKAALCMCHCHKGHYRHYWTPIIKTPAPNADGTYYLMDRCKYCPDVRLKIIKPGWINEKMRVIAQEYLIRGEHRVLTREEFYERAPRKFDEPELRKQAGL